MVPALGGTPQKRNAISQAMASWPTFLCHATMPTQERVPLLRRLEPTMATDTRTTVYLKRKVYRALKAKAASTDQTVSDLINAAVLEAMREDDIDRAAVTARRKEPSRPFEKVIEDLKRDGLL